MSLATSIFDSLFQPGLNTPTRNIMNFAFFGLFITLGALAILTHGNGHVLALFAISVALFASVQWFLTELAKLPPSANQVQQMPAEADASEASNNADSDEKRKDQ